MVLLLLLLSASIQASETFEGNTYYLGEPHIHTGASGDGYSADLNPCSGSLCVNGAVVDFFDIAAANGLDWVAITDHGNGRSTADDADFDLVWQTVLDHDDEATGLVAIPAVEFLFSVAGDQLGHRNLYLFGGDEELAEVVLADLQPAGSDSTVDSCESIEDWLDALDPLYGPTLLVPHHPALTGSLGTDFSCWSEDHEQLVEVYSGWGNSMGGFFTEWDTPYNTVEGGFVSDAMDPDGLARRFGFLAGTDDHYTMPGDLCVAKGSAHIGTGGLSVVVIPDSETFDRDAVYDAWTDRRTYATTGPLVPVALDLFEAGDLLGSMGQDFELVSGARLDLELRVPVDWESSVLEVFLVTPDEQLTMVSTATATWRITLADDEVPAWIYAAVQLDGAVVYGSSICDDGGADTDEWLFISPSWLEPVQDLDGDGFLYLEGDCDDRDDSVYRGAPDTWYDGVDSDCDLADDFDADVDGHRSVLFGGFDCDDTDSLIHPGVIEVWYDGIDSDCDRADDYDADHDGHRSVRFDGDDCDDTSASIHPGVTEVWYDGVDSDCDRADDYDADADGHSSMLYGGTDCDDTDSLVHPDVTEIWYDGIDSDCDGADDFDADADGHSATLYGGTDCVDTDASIHPSAPDTWYDGIDSDCDGADDFDADADGHPSTVYGGADCDDADSAIHPSAPDTWYDGVDSDCDGADDFDADADGYPSALYGGADCDDADGSIHPSASDTWYDGVDSDCDRADDFDADADGYRSSSYGGDDCDDTDRTVHPDAPDTWYDGLDSDCDGANDYDADGDGYPRDLDCDDTDPQINHGAPGTWHQCSPEVETGCFSTGRRPRLGLLSLALLAVVAGSRRERVSGKLDT